jgi:L-threonylcarbamoyladenylate synthase
MKETQFIEALNALKTGKLIIYPTDTLYALGADVYNEAAVRHVFEIKQRPYSIPLPIAVSSLEAMDTVAFVNEIARKLSETYLPGPLTIILKKKPILPDVLTGGHDTIAVRIPNHPIALKLLQRYGPLTATSANLHKKTTPGNIKDILIQLHTVIPVSLDDGRLDGAPSTIVDLSSTTPRIVRQGSIAVTELLKVMNHG